MTRECKYCGIGNLHWVDSGGKWVLHDSKNKRHFCQPEPVQPARKEVPGGKIYVLKDFKNDPLIKKALKEFKKKL